MARARAEAIDRETVKCRVRHTFSNRATNHQEPQIVDLFGVVRPSGGFEAKRSSPGPTPANASEDVTRPWRTTSKRSGAASDSTSPSAIEYGSIAPSGLSTRR